ncbi:MAG: tRNA pseudouridine(38-40) synthase TruA [Alphaproteobacteria bacterium]|nr:tRNA pseudouridine(38-40) synthase TruA [Alphaproteobacteria bacterium]
MPRWKLTIEYDGSGFCGWQRQTNAGSVQQTLEEAIAKFSGEIVTLHVAGRTDAGVHARAQVAHFDLNKETSGDIIRDALNFYLRPNKIAILNAAPVDENFHARFDALKRSYRYRIINRRAPLALHYQYAWHVAHELDIGAMQQAADVLIGHHDFSTFRARNCQANSPVKTLDRCDLTRDGEEIIVTVEARSFLYHQVRNMAGTLCLVGTGRLTLDDFKTAFAACDRAKGGPTAPAQGLCLWSVSYPHANDSAGS